MKQILYMLLVGNSISKVDDKSLNTGVIVGIVAIIVAFILAIIMVEIGG